MGAIAGYFGGWIDTLVSRLTEIAMAFPILLFIDRAGQHRRPAAERHHARRSSAPAS